jgi:AraC-like DNA-binding protein
MKQSASLADYLAHPTGRCLCGPTYLVWCKDTRLSGMVFWGRPEPEHMARVTRAIEIAVAPDGEQRASLVDARRVESVIPATFDVLAHYVQSRLETLKRRVRAQALLRPAGFVGAAVAGFYEVLGQPYPTKVFTNPDQALVWLGAVEHRDVVLELDGCLDDGCDRGILCSLRAHLNHNPGKACLGEAAAALGLSARSLQRKLRESSSSFQTELNLAQIRIAKRLMLDTDYEIKRVALEVGCSSASAFNVLFRRLERQAPSAWRSAQCTARHRAR